MWLVCGQWTRSTCSLLPSYGLVFFWYTLEGCWLLTISQSMANIGASDTGLSSPVHSPSSTYPVVQTMNEQILDELVQGCKTTTVCPSETSQSMFCLIAWSVSVWSKYHQLDMIWWICNTLSKYISLWNCEPQDMKRLWSGQVYSVQSASKTREERVGMRLEIVLPFCLLKGLHA